MTTTSAKRHSRPRLDTELFDRLMRARGCTNNTECGRALGLHASTIARMRAGSTSPTYSAVLRLVDVLGVPDVVLFPREADR